MITILRLCASILSEEVAKMRHKNEAQHEKDTSEYIKQLLKANNSYSLVFASNSDIY